MYAFICFTDMYLCVLLTKVQPESKFILYINLWMHIIVHDSK